MSCLHPLVCVLAILNSLCLVHEKLCVLPALWQQLLGARHDRQELKAWTCS